MNKIETSYRDVEGILDIGKKGLCHRCGGCIGICPSGTLALDEDCYPKQVKDCSKCSLCTDICSGAVADFPTLGKWLFGSTYNYEGPMGEIHQAFVGHSTDEKIRWGGASGGVVTQLLSYLLETGRITGALVAAPHPDDPALGLGYIARNKEDLLKSGQSRYTTTPMLTALQEISRDKEGNYAVVALPCHAHTIRKLQMRSKIWQKRISTVIGLYCHYRLAHEATREAGALLAPAGSKLTSIKYRQKDQRGWPYNTVEMNFSDGSLWRSPYGPAQTVSLLAHCYPRGRCLLCVDALAEFADLVVGDPWIRDTNGEWKYSSPGGWSGIITRTSVGKKILDEAVQDDALKIKAIPPEEIVEGQHVMINEKAESAPIRMRLLKFAGHSLPHYGIRSPPITLKKLFHEIMFFLMRSIAIFGPVRRFFVRLGFSKPGQKFMGWRRKLNKKRAKIRLSTQKKTN